MRRPETNHWKYDGSLGSYKTKLGQGRSVETVRKSADETVNNSTTFQNDDALLLAVRANTTWVVKLALLVNSSAVADFKVQITGPAGSTIEGFFAGLDATGNSPGSFGASLTLPGAGANELKPIEFLVIIGSTAGDIQVQWAQNTAQVSDTKVLADSCLVAVQLQ